MAEIDNDIAKLLEDKHAEEIKKGDEETKMAEFRMERDKLKEELDKSFDLQQAAEKFTSLEDKEKEIEDDLKQETEECYADILEYVVYRAKFYMDNFYIKGRDEDAKMRLAKIVSETKRGVKKEIDNGMD